MQPVRLFDGNDVPMDVQDGVVVPAGTSMQLFAGKDAAGIARTLRTADDGSISQRMSGRVSIGNSSTVLLGVGATFVGVFEEILDVGQIHVLVRASHASAAGGLVAEYSIDGVAVDDSDSFTIPANTGKVYAFPPHARYFRLRYTNGPMLQTSFRLQTIYKGGRTKPSTHSLSTAFGDNDDAELQIGVTFGRQADGSYRAIKIGTDGRMLIDDRSVALLSDLVESSLLSPTLAENMGVNGSAAPVVFTFEPGVDDVELEDISLLVEQSGIVFGDKFFSATINTLANGLLIEVKANDVLATIRNLKRTRDMVEFASAGAYLSETFAMVDMMRSILRLPSGGTLLKKAGTFSTPDYIRVTVRDNLSQIGFLRASIRGIKR